MATWPSGTKASTTNLDAGTDRPSLARPDIKQNVDNVNSIIDMFNISSPSNNNILKYSTGTNAFELAPEPTSSDTTYSISAEQDGTDANIVLTDSNLLTDSVQLVAGTNVALTVDSAGAVTIDATASGIANVVEDTTPQLGGNLDVNGNSIVSTSAGNISITPDTTGSIVLDGLSWPTSDGSTGQALVTDGLGSLYWTTFSSTALENVSEDTTPQLGGTLDGQANTVQDIQLENYKETVYTLSYAATITPDVANGNVQKMSATGDFTFSAFSNPEAGQTLTLIVDHNGAARTLTSTMSFAGGDDALSTSDTVDIISVFYDGTTYYASIAKNFS